MTQAVKSVAIPLSVVLSSPVHFLAFGFGSGLAPKAPGTVGTLVAIPLYWLLSALPLWGYLAAVLLVSVAGIGICGASSRRLGVHDHSGIVWDEFAGFLLTMTAMPARWEWVVLGFVLFRLFDIWKPWLVGWADRHDGPAWVMLDDLFAGLFAAIVSVALAGLYHGVLAR